jgi:hypothetical protein
MQDHGKGTVTYYGKDGHVKVKSHNTGKIHKFDYTGKGIGNVFDPDAYNMAIHASKDDIHSSRDVKEEVEAEDEAGTDPTNTKHEHSQGYSDASRGTNKNPYDPNTPTGRAYMDGQAAYKRHFSESQELALICSRAGLAETAPYQPETDADHNDPLAAKAADDAAVGAMEEDGVDPVNAQGQDAEDLHGQATSSVAGAVDEAEYQGRKVQLGKKMAGDVKKSKVYVKGPKGNVVKVNFGDPNMRIKKSNPARRKSFRARHNCDNPGPRWKARFWSCRSW